MSPAPTVLPTQAVAIPSMVDSSSFHSLWDKSSAPNTESWPYQTITKYSLIVHYAMFEWFSFKYDHLWHRGMWHLSLGKMQRHLSFSRILRSNCRETEGTRTLFPQYTRVHTHALASSHQCPQTGPSYHRFNMSHVGAYGRVCEGKK